jgi:GxGYxYP putative glycoside hydrolase C-terminal domain/GxGYxYP_N second domain/GxGYxYP third domain/GxGYxYP_N 1st domain
MYHLNINIIVYSVLLVLIGATSITIASDNNVSSHVVTSASDSASQSASPTALRLMSIFGSWQSVTNSSTELPLFNSLFLNISQHSTDYIALDFAWGASSLGPDVVVQNWLLRTDGTGSTQSIPVQSRVFETNVFMGVEYDVNIPHTVTATLSESNVLVVSVKSTVLVSQGASPVTTVHKFSALSSSSESASLRYDMKRSSRNDLITFMMQPIAPGAPSTKRETHQHTMSPDIDCEDASSVSNDTVRFRPDLPSLDNDRVRAGPGQHFYVNLSGSDWTLGGGLSHQVLLLATQGLANRLYGPSLYFVYPSDWAFTYSAAMLDFYKTQYRYEFTELTSVEQVVSTFRDIYKGYVVWDRNAPDTMSVALTLAGQRQAAVITEELVSIMKNLNVPLIEDFRGRFVNQSEAQIIEWAYNEYFQTSNKSFIMWLGGTCWPTKHPAVADFGVMSGAFFAADLSTKPSDTIEFNLANKIVGSLNKYAVTVGWHSYCKDAEHYFTTLMSHHTARVHGLNTLPNLSFINKVPLNKSFEFRNNHYSGPTTPANKSVYIACVQSDGLGLGAWLKPGRGEIEYTWEVTVNDLWLQPTMLEMFYRQATPRDFFVGALSSAGYQYPKAIPEQDLPVLLGMANDFLATLDLNAMAMMDESQGTTVVGNMNLPKRVVDTYFDVMTNAESFVNGYAPSFTFSLGNGSTPSSSRPFLSYDYYLAPDRPDIEVVNDIKELASLNTQRPYFQVIHVREFSNILRVKDIMAQLGPEYELVHYEHLMQMARDNPTFTTRYEEDPQ